MSEPSQRNLNTATGFMLLPPTVDRLMELLDERDAEHALALDAARAEAIEQCAGTCKRIASQFNDCCEATADSTIDGGLTARGYAHRREGARRCEEDIRALLANTDRGSPAPDGPDTSENE